MAKKKILSLAQISNKYKSAGKASEILALPEDMLWLPSTNIKLNYTLGGGIPYGRILELYGEESSGKSLLAYNFAYCAQQLGGHVIWADAENCFTQEWALKNGLDLDRVHLADYTAVEEISDWLFDMVLALRNELTNNEPILFVCDSLAALDCKANIDSEQTDAKAEMGNRAKAIYKMLRIRNKFLDDMGICSIFINQLRKKVGAGMFEDPDTTPGGAAMKFYASLRIGVYGGKQIREKVGGKEKPIGRITSIRPKKNKVAPMRSTYKGAEMVYDEESGREIGLDRYVGLPELLVELGVLERKKGSSWFSYKGENIAQGEEKLMKLIKNDDSLRQRLLRRTKINTISTTRKKIEKLQTNQYSVEDYV